MRFGGAGGVVGVVAVAVGALWLLGGWLLSLVTTRVANWFVMTDELYYERLAISIAHSGSLVPRMRGEVVANVNQLYPALLSLVYGDGDVQASFESAHRLNAFVMASAAVPLYLLARRVGVSRAVSLWVAATGIVVPWMVLASFLLTEVVAYPAFCWALLALAVATARKTSGADALAFAALGLAVLARTQFLVLLPAFVLAALAECVLAGVEAGEPWRQSLRRLPERLARTRPLLVAVAGVLFAAAAFLALLGELPRVLGAYAAAGEGIRVDSELLRLGLAHVAALAFGLLLLPFLVGSAWLADRMRPSAPAPERAFALVGTTALLLVTAQVASFDQRFGAGEVKDRYLFYVVPVVLVALAAALRPQGWPRPWALLPAAALAALGFLWLPLPRYVKLNVDSPLAALNDGLLRLATSEAWARALLLLALLVALQLVLLGSFLWRRAAALAAAAVATLGLAGETAYAFHRLFAVDGTNGLPLTLEQGGVFGWVDRTIGKDGRAAMIRYPVNMPDYWASVGYWWDTEFWNETVVRDAFPSEPAEPEAWTRAFDPRSGAALGDREHETPYVVVQKGDVRFRLAGEQVHYERDAYLVRAELPWRAAFVTYGIYGDGWTRPHTPAELRVFASPGQRTAQHRFLTLSLAAPETETEGARPVAVTTAGASLEHGIAPGTAFEPAVSVCVPPGGYGTVRIETPHVSAVYRDPTVAPLTGEVDRPAGVQLRWVALADETEDAAGCPAW